MLTATSHATGYIVTILVLVAFRENHVCGMECGRVNMVQLLVRGGNAVLRNEWPFIVAVYEVNPMRYICGGTLISIRHILTAAHCVHRRHSDVRLSADDIKVRLGAFNLTVESETGAENRNVSAVHVNPDWKPYADNYDADLAILVASENVTFSIFIQPICIPPNDVIVDGAVIDVNGTVVGWGLHDDTVHEEIPIKMKATALTNSLCYRIEPNLIKSSSFRSFCARGDDGTISKGDSGGGFFTVSRFTWVQYGIVSALSTNEHSNAIYTNIKPFKSWIVETVTNSGGEVGELVEKIGLDCRLHYFGRHGYACEFNKLQIGTGYTEVTSITGFDDTGIDSDNVTTVSFGDGFMFTLPDGLGKIFRNMKHLKIEYLGMQYIYRSSLKDMENLQYFLLFANNVATLDEYCFWDVPNMTVFAFIHSKLEALPERIFERNTKLTGIFLSGNQLQTVPKNVFKHNSLLEVIRLNGNLLRTIDEQMFANNEQLRVISMSSNQLDYLPINLFKNNVFLEGVSLDHNSLNSIEEQLFEKNENLKSVALSWNQLILLPEKLFKNNLLIKEIYLGNNGLTVIDDRTFEANVQLKTVDISSNRLKNLTKNLFRNNLLLTNVHLSTNWLQTIEEQIFETNIILREIRISFNRLEYLPGKLFENNLLLEIVDLRNNSLKAIPESIFAKNIELKRINLQSNGLESLPGRLFKFNRMLELVFIADNLLTSINETIFETNVELVTVVLSFNQFTSLSKSLFKNNLLLENVEVIGNRLRALDEHLFETNVKLYLVNASSNQLHHLPKELFENNLLLEDVDFSNNLLRTIHEEMFATNLQLKIVFLSSNQLEYLPRDLFKNNILLESVRLKHNVLKVIDINFTELKRIDLIELYGNVCVNAFYSSDAGGEVGYFNLYSNLNDFQNIIVKNCTFTYNSMMNI